MAEPTAAAGVTSVGRSRILVVDDNMDSAESMATLLKLDGHEVRVAYNGLAAVESALAFRPQVVLLDIGLPGLDGYEVARRLRLSNETKDIFLIALTGYGRTEDRVRALTSGFNYHITKPVDPGELDMIIKKLTPGRSDESVQGGVRRQDAVQQTDDVRRERSGHQVLPEADQAAD
jgi:DNA-binding response OmpR family regulator